jgi:hypothetical protein
MLGTRIPTVEQNTHKHGMEVNKESSYTRIKSNGVNLWFLKYV